MKSSIFTLSFYLGENYETIYFGAQSFRKLGVGNARRGSLQSLSKGKGRRKKPQVITGTVGQTITLSMHTRDRFAGIFYRVDVTPN